MSDYVLRFSVRQRCEHLAVMLLFIVLAVTGFPQKFFDGHWARWMIATLGGIDQVRWLHRMAGIAFSAVAVVHVMSAVAGVLTGRTGWTMVPTRKDFTDAVVTLRYYLGLQDEHAHFDRYDYRQKFEYWGLILGGVVMVTTGFILYFPVRVAQIFPGEAIPAAKVAHSNEGLLAFLVVIIWHIYNAHLSPDVFPFDTAIFTGRVSRERMLHEHPLEYARLSEASGTARETEHDG
jgi:formate dehydrogenase subunit gamma